MVLNLTVGLYVRNFIFFFYKHKKKKKKKKIGEIPIFRTFFAEKLNFGLSVVWAKSTIMTSL